MFDLHPPGCLINLPSRFNIDDSWALYGSLQPHPILSAMYSLRSVAKIGDLSELRCADLPQMIRENVRLLFLYALRSNASCEEALRPHDFYFRLARKGDIGAIRDCNLRTLPENYTPQVCSQCFVSLCIFYSLPPPLETCLGKATRPCA